MPVKPCQPVVKYGFVTALRAPSRRTRDPLELGKSKSNRNAVQPHGA